MVCYLHLWAKPPDTLYHKDFFISVIVSLQLEKKDATPPFKPQISDDYGLENFDTQFTNEPVQLTPDDE